MSVRRLLGTGVVLVWLAAEMVVLNWLVGRVGWLWVIALMCVQFAIGILVAQRAGATAFRQLAHSSRDGSLPGGEVGDSVLVALAGALIALPGVVSDAAAALLLIPFTRRWVRRLGGAAIGRRVQAAGFSTAHTTSADGITVTRLYEGTVVEGTVISSDSDATAHSAPSGPELRDKLG